MYRPMLALLAVPLGCGASPAGDRAAPPPAHESRAAPAKAAEPEVPEDLVRFHLIADVTRAAPGQELTVAARFEVQPAWHIYWENPGESGLATEVSMTATDGFEVGALRYPAPQRFDAPGGVVNYGYDDVVLLSAQVTAPDPLPPDGAHFRATASWLACRDVCVPGKATAILSLPPATAGEPSKPANEKLFAEHRQALPRPFSDLAGGHQELRRDGDRATLTLTVPGAEHIEYFPSRQEQVAFSGTAGIPGETSAQVHITYNTKTSVPERSRGVVALTRAGQASYYRIDVPWSQEKTK